MTVPVVRFTVAGEDEKASAGLGRAYPVVYDGDCRVCPRLAGVLEPPDPSHPLEECPLPPHVLMRPVHLALSPRPRHDPQRHIHPRGGPRSRGAPVVPGLHQ